MLIHMTSVSVSNDFDAARRKPCKAHLSAR
jgi:hypothetical protein